MKETSSRRGFMITLGRLAAAGTAGLALRVATASQAEAACAIWCKVVVCDWTRACPGWSLTFRCYNSCDGSTFIHCKSFAEPCKAFCMSANAC